MIAEFTVMPIGKVSMSPSLAHVMRLIDDSGLDYRVGPMGTCVEGSWDQVMRLIRRCHETLRASSPRVYTSIRIDDRKGPSKRLARKVASVAWKSGRLLKT